MGGARMDGGRGPGRKGLRSWALGLLLAACAALLGMAAALLGVSAAATGAYDVLAQEVVDAGGMDVGLDALTEQNPDYVGWLTVEGTSISYPVVQPSEDEDADFYLTHDYWGALSGVGCPYLDQRASAEGAHLLVYGHHLSLSDQMFSPIYQAYLQEVFDGIGTATWTAPDGETTEFTPVFALSVDKSYAAIQTFSFSSKAELHAWLRTVAAGATAEREGWEELVQDADRVLTLVTCSSTMAGQRERTLLVFVAS